MHAFSLVGRWPGRQDDLFKHLYQPWKGSLPGSFYMPPRKQSLLLKRCEMPLDDHVHAL